MVFIKKNKQFALVLGPITPVLHRRLLQYFIGDYSSTWARLLQYLMEITAVLGPSTGSYFSTPSLRQGVVAAKKKCLRHFCRRHNNMIHLVYIKIKMRGVPYFVSGIVTNSPFSCNILRAYSVGYPGRDTVAPRPVFVRSNCPSFSGFTAMSLNFTIR